MRFAVKGVGTKLKLRALALTHSYIWNLLGELIIVATWSFFDYISKLSISSIVTEEVIICDSHTHRCDTNAIMLNN